jgi:hypothetical protein
VLGHISSYIEVQEVARLDTGLIIEGQEVTCLDTLLMQCIIQERCCLVHEASPNAAPTSGWIPSEQACPFVTCG